MPIIAVEQIRRMRGGAQSHLMKGADDNFYVVKFQNNPQHLRVLANEMLATRLAEALGITVPVCEVIDVSSRLIDSTSELEMETRCGRERCLPGLQFGSLFVGGLMPGNSTNYLPDEMLLEVRNLREFAGMLAFDKWTGNTDGRQVVFSKKMKERRYHATFIDQGYCFNAGQWRFSDAPLLGVYGRNAVYQGIVGWENFEPWLDRIEKIAPEKVWDIAETVPPEWYGGDDLTLERLVEQLILRRGRVRQMIEEFRNSSRSPFPNWQGGKAPSLGPTVHSGAGKRLDWEFTWPQNRSPLVA